MRADRADRAVRAVLAERTVPAVKRPGAAGRGVAAVLLALLLLLAGSPLAAAGLESPRTATSRRGVVAAGSAEAALAGAEVLEAGGNAVDAAVASAFALAVTYPQAGNLAGGGFLVARTAKGELFALDFRETAPAKLRREAFVDANGDPLPGASTLSGLSVGVPGSVRGLEAVHRKLGRLPWRAVVAPSVRLAREGFRVPAKLSLDIAASRKELSAHEASRAVFLPGGEPLRPGALLVQTDLAATLSAIAGRGSDAFHRGPVAEKIAAYVRATGGVMTAEDLASYVPEWREPIVFDYGDWRLVTMPPPSSGGFVLASVLGQLSARGLLSPKLDDADDIHVVLEAERRAYADRNRWLGDPGFVDVPLARLLEPRRIASLASSIDPFRSTPSAAVSGEIAPPGKKRESEETTHLSVATAEGDAVSLTTTLNLAFGNGAVVPGVGVLLNNEMDDFATAPGRSNTYGLVQGEANAVRPGARPLSSMTPLLAFEKGRLSLVIGSPGGSTIPTTALQVFLRAGPGRAPLPGAVAAARLHQQHLPDVVFVEEERPPSPQLAEGLTKKGHVLRRREPIGVVHAVACRPDGSILGVADPRSSGAASAAGAVNAVSAASTPRP